jgi:hypothetical protein
MAAQALFDALAGAGGHPVDRPALDAYVATSQATNGLRSAQTDQALVNAQRMQQQEQEKANFKAKFGATPNPVDGRLPDPATVELVGSAVGAGMPIQNLGELLSGNYKSMAQNTLGSPDSTPEQRTLAQQMYEGKVALPYAVPKEYSTLPGGAVPNVQQTPLGIAEASAQNANATLHHEQATNPGAFHSPGATGAPLDAQHVSMLQYLEHAGIIDPAHVSRFNASPGALEAAYAVLKANPDFTGAGHATMQASERDFMSNSPSSSGGKLTRGLAIANHMDLIDDLSDALKNNDLRAWNWAKNELGLQIGDPDPNNLNLAAHFVGRELTTFLAANGGTGAEAEAAAKRFSEANAPDQAHGATAKGRILMAGQFDALRSKYKAAGGARPDFEQRFLGSNPGALGILQEFDAARATRHPTAVPPPVAPNAAPTPGAAPDPLGIR